MDQEISTCKETTGYSFSPTQMHCPWSSTQQSGSPPLQPICVEWVWFITAWTLALSVSENPGTSPTIGKYRRTYLWNSIIKWNCRQHWRFWNMSTVIPRCFPPKRSSYKKPLNNSRYGYAGMVFHNMTQGIFRRFFKNNGPTICSSWNVHQDLQWTTSPPSKNFGTRSSNPSRRSSKPER